MHMGGRRLTHFDVVTSNGGLIATEVKDANPEFETKVYDFVTPNWIVQP